MFLGVLELLLITMVFCKILRQFKTCVLYFSFIQQMIPLKKLWKMLFTSSNKLFSFSRYLNFCISVFSSYVIRMSLVCTCMSPVCHSYVILISLVCTRMSFLCHSCVLVCHPYVTHMNLYVIRTSLYVLVCHPYFTRMYSYAIHMSSVCRSYVFVCHLYVTAMWFHHESWKICAFFIKCLSVFRNLSNNYGRLFWKKKKWRLKVVNYFF